MSDISQNFGTHAGNKIQPPYPRPDKGWLMLPIFRKCARITHEWFLMVLGTSYLVTPCPTLCQIHAVIRSPQSTRLTMPVIWYVVCTEVCSRLIAIEVWSLTSSTSYVIQDLPSCNDPTHRWSSSQIQHIDQVLDHCSIWCWLVEQNSYIVRVVRNTTRNIYFYNE